MRKILVETTLGVLAVALVAAACGGSSKQTASTPAPKLNPADFHARVDNPFFSLIPGARRVYEGEEADAENGERVRVRVESTVLAQTDTIAGVEVTVVQVKDFEGDELVEDTRDYYAQDADGSVYYFGERLDEYQDGKIVGHSGQWLASDGENQPGIFMPYDPKVGAEFTQEGAPGVAQDRGRVAAVDQTVETPAGSFSGCVKIEEFDPLEDFTVVNYFCPDAGLVHEEPPGGSIDLVSFTKT
jgi:hypothetical protein